MSTHTHDTGKTWPKPISEGSDRPDDPGQALADALHDAEATLDALPPQVEGLPPIATFREWIEHVTFADHWVQHTPSIRQEFWEESKKHVSRLVEIVRPHRGLEGLPLELVERFNRAMRLYTRFGGFYALNYAPRPKDEAERRKPQYSFSNKQKVEVLDAILDGWTLADGNDEHVPGLLTLLVEEPMFARKGLTSLTQYFTHIDYYLKTLEHGTRAHRPVYLGPPPTEPTVLAQDVWVQYMIRYHKQDMTIRESVMNTMRAIGKGNSESGRPVREFWPLRGVSLRADPGDIVGIIGQNGSGKTTLLKTLAGILGADRGRVTVRGKVGCLLSFGVGFNAQLSGRENVYLNGSILGLSEREIDERFDRIVELCELGQFIDAPARTYSAGMRGRLGFAIAIHIDPDVLILDEVLTVGDAYFRDKAGSVIDRFRDQNKTIIIASHSMDLVRKMCTKAMWLDRGQVRLEGTPGEVTRTYVEYCRLERAAHDT